jgi:hypothetical protein
MQLISAAIPIPIHQPQIQQGSIDTATGCATDRHLLATWAGLHGSPYVATDALRFLLHPYHDINC